MNKIFSYKEYSDESLFTNTGKRTDLKEYKDNLVFYDSCNTNLNAEFGYSNKVPEVSGDVENLNNGVFGQYIKNSGSLTFEKENFLTLTDKGCLKFRLGTNTLTAYGYQRILLKDVFTVTNNTYSFNLQVGTFGPNEVSFLLTSTMTRSDVLNTVLVAIDPSYKAAVDTSDLSNILIKSDFLGDVINITSGTTGIDFLSVFSVEESKLPNSPVTPINFLSIENGINNNGKINFVHYTDTVNNNSMINVLIYNNSGVLATTLSTIWNNDINLFYAFELDFNKDIAYLFIDGELKDFKKTGFIRNYNDCYFKLNSGGTAYPYNFDEIILFSTQINCKSYLVETSPLTKYSTEIPYVDYYFNNDFIEGTIEQCLLDSTNNISFIVYSGNVGYYYLSGAWRVSDGTFNSSTDVSTFETKIITFPFIESELVKIRAFFESDGTNVCYIDDFEFIISDSIDGDLTDTPAILLGSVLLPDSSASTGLNLTTNYPLIIATDKGNTTVDLRTNASDITNIRAQEIVDAINSANPAGINRASLNSLNQIYLVGTTRGKSAFISVAGLAAPIVFGGEVTAIGQDAITTPVDYSVLFGYVKRKLGYPTVPVEITDGQMSDVLQDAINLYNKWRNYSVQTLYVDLAGTSSGGYEIPAIIGSERNIIDIIFKPRTPFGIYDSNSFEYNIYIQQLFNKYGRGGARTGFLTDYSISMNFITDSNLILGTEPRWEVRDRKIYIYPKPPTSLFNVAIKYKGQMSIDEIMSDDMVKKYMTGACRKILGTIRSTFGGTVSAGETTLQMDGASMTSLGTTEMEEALKEMKGESEPLGFIVG